MPDIPTGSQIFDVCFAPNSQHIYAGLLSGEVKGFRYDEQGQNEPTFTLRPAKKSCRSLAVSEDGASLWAVGKAKSIFTIDLPTGVVSDTREGVHDAAINRVNCIRPHTIVTGDDDGVIKLWDMRKPEPVRAYTHHFDFITDFLWLEDKKQLVATSGDGTLSVLDIRASKPEPFAHSEDQEDELLSIVPIKGGTKFVVGTQQGVLSIFNRASGWGDCVDRIPGHPHSVDALCTIPDSYPSAHSTVLTGSSDGLVRVVQLYPTQMLGTLADHGEFPVERVRVDAAGQGRWVASVGHEEAIRMTDLRDVFEDEAAAEAAEAAEDAEESAGAAVEDEDDEGMDDDAGSDDEAMSAKAEAAPAAAVIEAAADSDEEEPAEPVAHDEHDSDEDGGAIKERKRKRKDKDPLAVMKRAKKASRNEVQADKGFFADL